MNTFEQKIQSYVRKIFQKKISYDNAGLSPVRDWGVMLAYTSGIVLVVIGASLYIYLQISNNTFFTTPADTSDTHVSLNKILLKKTVDDIVQKQSAFSDAQSGKNAVSDPSL